VSTLFLKRKESTEAPAPRALASQAYLKNWDRARKELTKPRGLLRHRPVPGEDAAELARYWWRPSCLIEKDATINRASRGAREALVNF
jgi:hypothetical protein